MRLIGLSCALLLAACSGGDRPAAVGASAAPVDWRALATPEDRLRLRNWRSAFTEALRAARAAGHAVDIRREGALLMPDAALAGPALPPGDYRCRVIKLGGQGDLLDYVSYPAFTCRVEAEDGVASFRKLSGSQRQVGTILAGDAQRQIFLGTLVLGDERRALHYGMDAERNLVGAIERVGEERWRLILPYPRFESIMDVIELVPVRRSASVQ